MHGELANHAQWGLISHGCIVYVYWHAANQTSEAQVGRASTYVACTEYVDAARSLAQASGYYKQIGHQRPLQLLHVKGT